MNTNENDTIKNLSLDILNLIDEKYPEAKTLEMIFSCFNVIATCCIKYAKTEDSIKKLFKDCEKTIIEEFRKENYEE